MEEHSLAITKGKVEVIRATTDLQAIGMDDCQREFWNEITGRNKNTMNEKEIENEMERRNAPRFKNIAGCDFEIRSQSGVLEELACLAIQLRTALVFREPLEAF
jgi:hypothetical protein